MPSSGYQSVRAAMEARLPVVCIYQGYEREICFHCIGYGIDGGEKALGFQYAGGSSKGLPPGGQWRCLNLDQLESVRSKEGGWHSGQGHSKPQSCVKEVHFEVTG